MKIKALMCEPRYYKVGWEGPENPWLNMDMQPDRKLAYRQWKKFRDFLESLGVEIYLLGPKPGLGDQVFTANVAWGMKNAFIMANFAPTYRRPETEIAVRWFIENRYHLWDGDLCLKFLPEDVFFEGQGNMITTKHAYLYCHGHRNSVRAKKEIEKTFNLRKPVVVLKLIDPEFYDGDLAIRYFPHRDGIMFCPEAFDDESIDYIERKLRAKNKKAVSKKFAIQILGEEGRNFTLNGCYIDKVVTFPWKGTRKSFPKDILSWCEADGGEIWLSNFSQLGISGGGQNCVVNFLTRFIS